MSYYAYAAKPGGLDYVSPNALPGYAGTPRQAIIIIIAMIILIAIVWFLKNRK